jgi:peroxiredoxin
MENFQVFRALPKAYEFDMQGIDGTPLALAGFQGRLLLMNFWRKDCHYCEMEKQLLRSMLRKLNNPAIQVLCVNLWDNPNYVRRYAAGSRDLMFATKNGNRESVVSNVVGGRLMGYYVVNRQNEAIYEVKGFPTTYVIDGNGRVVATHFGMAQWDNPQVLKWLAGLASGLGGRARVAPAGLDRLMGGAAQDSRPVVAQRGVGMAPDRAQ